MTAHTSFSTAGEASPGRSKHVPFGESTVDEAVAVSQKPQTIIPVLLTPQETAQRLRLSVSWLAKSRMRGDGPPYIQIGRAIRYAEAALIQWMKCRQRLSTSEQ
jgi:predicted DNA-binding transcriptional regulator AlpA